MKKKYIMTGAIALIISAAAAGVSSTVMAAGNVNGGGFIGRFMGQAKTNLTDAQKADLKLKMAAVKTALDAGDYNAWVTAVKAMNANSPLLQKVTSSNFSQYVQTSQQREADMAAQKTKLDAVNAALTANDYNAWVTAVTAANPTSPVLQKINASNFGQYVQAFNLRNQADTIMTTLGLGQGSGMMGGFGQGGMRGHGRGIMGGLPVGSNTAAPSVVQGN